MPISGHIVTRAARQNPRFHRLRRTGWRVVSVRVAGMLEQFLHPRGQDTP